MILVIEVPSESFYTTIIRNYYYLSILNRIIASFIYSQAFSVGFPRDRDHPVGSPGPVGKRDGTRVVISRPVPSLPSLNLTLNLNRLIDKIR